MNSRKKGYILYIWLSACLQCDRWGDPRHHPQNSWIFSCSCGDGSSSASETPQSAITPTTHQSASTRPPQRDIVIHSTRPRAGRQRVDRFGPFSNTTRRMDGAANSNSAPSEKLAASHHIVCITKEKHGNKIFNERRFSTGKKTFDKCLCNFSITNVSGSLTIYPINYFAQNFPLSFYKSITSKMCTLSSNFPIPYWKLS